uniref:Uncharacterized protein n=2 Tax=Guillardia theta TaxID=55529 RepID=A0A6U6BP05_GUITH|mmetsp:Transcript_40383/g.127083  ORF Transcript_40383/g.127083 Transcript_40383/m.127083 type:complete len:243 (+) Transcript_40383:188-916(+)
MDLRGEITSFLARLEREHESGEKEAELMEIMRTDVELCVRVTCQLFCSELLHLSSYQSNLLLSCLRQTVEEEARDDKHASSFLRSLLCLPHLRQGMVPRVASVVALLVGLNASVFLLFKEYFCEILPRSEESVKIALLSVMDVCADRVKGDRDLLLLLFPLLDHPSPIIVGSTLHLLDNVFRTEDEVSIYFLRRALVTGVTSPPNVDLVEDQDVHSSPLRVVDGSALFHLKEVRQEEEEEEE